MVTSFISFLQPIRIVEAVVAVNEARKKNMAAKIIAACGGNVHGKTVAMLGLTFKPDTDDMRDAPSLDIVPALIAGGAELRVYDPKGMDEARNLLDGVVWCEDAYDAAEGADVLVTDTWVSMGKEDEKLQRLRDLTPYKVSQELMSLAKDDANFIHCLPADRGYEVDDYIRDYGEFKKFPGIDT